MGAKTPTQVFECDREGCPNTIAVELTTDHCYRWESQGPPLAWYRGDKLLCPTCRAKPTPKPTELEKVISNVIYSWHLEFPANFSRDLIRDITPLLAPRLTREEMVIVIVEAIGKIPVHDLDRIISLDFDRIVEKIAKIIADALCVARNEKE